MKYITLAMLLLISAQASALIRTELLEPEMYVSLDHLIFVDKFDRQIKVRTNCEHKPNKAVDVKIIGRTLHEDTQIRMGKQSCKVTDVEVVLR